MADGALDRTLSVCMTAAVMVMASAVAFHELRPRTRPSQNGGPPEYLAQWQAMSSVARPIGDTSAVIHLLEFADLECPACRVFNQGALADIQKKYGPKVRVDFVHFPLRIHRFASIAAQAAECAAYQGRFEEFVGLSYDKQDSIGLKSWTSFALEAGVTDSAQFGRCLTSPRRSSLIDSGIATASRFDVHGTPTVIVNGWRFHATPTTDQLSATIEDILAGHKPTFGNLARGAR